MKICILGAGALGCSLGGMLTEAVKEVWPIKRNADQVDAMNRCGLHQGRGTRAGAENGVAAR